MIRMTANSGRDRPKRRLASLRTTFSPRTTSAKMKMTATLMSVPAKYEDFWIMLLYRQAQQARTTHKRPMIRARRVTPVSGVSGSMSRSGER